MEIISRYLGSLLAAAAVVVTLCGCAKAPYRTDPEVPNGGGGGPVDVTLTDYREFQTGVTELSGLCFNAVGSGFYAVSDRGGLYEINLEGGTVRELLSSGNDLEAVALDSKGSVIYAVDESTGEILTLSGDGYKTAGLLATVSIPGGGKKNRGPEGMAFHDGKLILANQAEPTVLVDFSIAEKKITAERTVTFATYLSDICYDQTDDTLWILDSKGPAVYHCKQDLTLLGTYRIPFVAQAEGLEVDHRRSCLWIGCDTTAKLYKVSIAF